MKYNSWYNSSLIYFYYTLSNLSFWLDEEIKENNINPSNILNRKQKLKKILDDTDKEKFDELVKYEEANYKIKSKISIKNVMELKDYYIHQQDTQIIFVAEINDLEQEMDQKKQRLAELK